MDSAEINFRNRSSQLIDFLGHEYGMFICDLNGTFIYVSENLYSLSGSSGENLIGKSWSELGITPICVSKTEQAFAQLKLDQSPVTIEIEYGSRNKTHRSAEIRMVPVIENGVVTAIDGVFTDTTEQKIAEEKQHIIQLSIDRIIDSVFWIDQRANIVFVNEAACKNLGYRREELESMTVFDVDPSIPREGWDEHWNSIMGSGFQSIQSVHRTKNGVNFPVEISANKVEYGNKRFNCAVARDITKRITVEEALRKSEEHYRSTLEDLLVGVVVHDANSQIIDFNKEACRLLGLSSVQMLGKVATDPAWKFVTEQGESIPLKDYPVYRVLNK